MYNTFTSQIKDKEKCQCIDIVFQCSEYHLEIIGGRDPSMEVVKETEDQSTL